MTSRAPAQQADIIAIELRRIAPARNIRRFYRLDITPDLFGGFLLIRQWGRIGASGRVVTERFDDEADAVAVMAQHSRRKQRRGYLPVAAP